MNIPAHSLCLFLDGNMWCCVFADFIDLQVSPAGFGKTREEAIANLRKNNAAEEKAR